MFRNSSLKSSYDQEFAFNAIGQRALELLCQLRCTYLGNWRTEYRASAGSQKSSDDCCLNRQVDSLCSPRSRRQPAQPERCSEFIAPRLVPTGPGCHSALLHSQAEHASRYNHHSGRPARFLTIACFLAPRRAIYPAPSLPPKGAMQHTRVLTGQQLTGSLGGISVQNLKLQKCCFLSGVRQNSCKHTEYPAKIHRKIIYSYVQPWGVFLFLVGCLGFFWWAAFYFCTVEIHVPPKPICNCPHST